MTAKMPAATAELKLLLLRTGSELLKALMRLKLQYHILDGDVHTLAGSTFRHDIQSNLQFASGVASWLSTACQTCGVTEHFNTDRVTAHISTSVLRWCVPLRQGLPGQAAC